MDNINESASKKRSEYETLLQEVLDEHGSARTITQILQEELFTSTSYTAGELSQKENRAEIISNLENAGNSTGCELCKSLKVQLSHILKELSSVRLIVDLLSKELNREQSESPRNSTTNKQWNQVSYNQQKTPNRQKSLRTTDNIPPQHIPESANRFEILANLTTDLDNHKTKNKSVKEASEHESLQQRDFAQKENNRLRSRQVYRKDLPKKIPTLINGTTATRVSTKYTRHNLKKDTQTTVDHKIVILGDSHARGLSSNVKNNLDDNYSVCGLVKPGVNITTQISSMAADINLLTKSDSIIFWAGSNDVSKNNSQEGLKHLVNFVQTNNHIPDMCSPPT